MRNKGFMMERFIPVKQKLWYKTADFIIATDVLLIHQVFKFTQLLVAAVGGGLKKNRSCQE